MEPPCPCLPERKHLIPSERPLHIFLGFLQERRACVAQVEWEHEGTHLCCLSEVHPYSPRGLEERMGFQPFSYSSGEASKG